MFSKKKNYFSLVFSDQEIQLVQANRKGQVLSAATLKLEPGIITRGQVKKPAQLGSLLKGFLNRKKLKTSFVAVGLPEIAAFNRVLTLPDLPLEELDDAVRWQSESLLPMSPREAYLDWMLLEKDKKSLRVLVVALPAKLVEDYAKILTSLGFQPVAFEPTSLSLARLAAPGEKSTLVIEVREKEAILVIVGPAQEIELTSTVSLKEAGQREEFFSTVKNLLDFHQKKLKGQRKTAVAKILLCGRGVNESLIAEVSKKTGLTTELASIKPLELASSVSLARKNVAAPIDEKTINLLPPRIQGIYDLAEKSRFLSSWVKFVVFSFFLIFFGFSVVAARTFFDLKKIEGDMIQIQASISPEMQAVEARAKIVTKKSQQVLRLVDSQEKTLDLIEAIQAVIPEEVSLDHWSIDFEKKEILINGLATHRDRLLDFRHRLEGLRRFSQIRVPLSSLEREENVNFTIWLKDEETH
jgi:Tfp pilus assembly PilM family ATPase/Tfp pilus assembly protein PilN